MMNLLPARNSFRDYLCARFRVAHRRKKPQLANLQRQLVVVGFVTKRSGHSATTGIDLADLESGDEAQQAKGGCCTDQALLMAVSVKQDGLVSLTE